MALPGVESVERQGAPPRVGPAEAPAVEEPRPGTASGGPAPAPAPHDGPGGGPPHVPPVDSYSLRLVSTRHLYDAGRP